jgi:hypothetical protein
MYCIYYWIGVNKLIYYELFMGIVEIFEHVVEE